MAGNPLGALSDQAFSQANLLNLQQIVASDCGIASVAPRAFSSLINLVELDLSRNRLTRVPSEAFEEVAQLRELRLSWNTMEEGSIPDGAFSALPALIRLELSGCGLRRLGAGAFDGLAQLQWLRLDNNRLARLSPAPLRPLSALHGVDLHGNPFNCSCQLRELRLWMLSANVPSSTPAPPSCAAPARLRGRAWDASLDADEFACLPRVAAVAATPATPAASASAPNSTVLTLFCRAAGVPRPTVSWTWQGQVVRNGSRADELLFVISNKVSFAQVRFDSVIENLLTVMNFT